MLGRGDAGGGGRSRHRAVTAPEGLRNSSVYKGSNEEMLKGHTYQMKEVFVVVVFKLNPRKPVSICALFSLDKEGGAKERCVLQIGEKRKVSTPRSSVTL